MRAVIIAGGEGVRMRPFSMHRPKPMVPVANRPLLEYQVGILRDAGITEIVFATNYKAERIKEHFGDGAAFGVSMSYRVEPEPMDTAGAIRYAVDGLPPDGCVVFNGDTLHDFEMRSILSFHEANSADVTLTLYRVHRPHPFGVVKTKSDGRVEAFIEPTREQKMAAAAGTPTVGDDLINAGLYVMGAKVVDQIPLRRCSIEREFYPRILDEGAVVTGCEGLGYWTDIGRPAQLLRATRALLSGELRLGSYLMGQKTDSGWWDAGAKVAVSASIERSCHLAGCEIATEAEVRNHTVVGVGSRIGGGTILDECIVMENVTVGEHCRLTRCIVDANTTIEDNVTANEVALGAGSRISAWSSLGAPIL